jgi:hypothetical protein
MSSFTVFAFSLAVLFLIVFTATNIYGDDWKNYTVEGKFSFNYPSDWNVTGKENRFDPYDAKVSNGSVSVTFDLDEDDPGYSNDDFILQSLETASNNSFDNLEIFEKGTDKYIINNQTAPYIIATFDEDRPFLPRNAALMFVFVKFGDNWIEVYYTSEKNDFDKYLATAEKIMKSIRPI